MAEESEFFRFNLLSFDWNSKFDDNASANRTNEDGLLELELEESFMSPIHDAIPKPPEASTSIEQIRLEDSRFDSIDAIMEEVEGNHHQGSLLEIDSEFGVTTSIERIRLENSSFLSSDPVDEMMEEVENNHLQESLLEMDSEFGGDGDDDLNLPTSAQQSTSTFDSFNLRNASVLDQHSDLTSDPLLPHWVDSTSIVATKLDGTKIRIPRRRKIGSDQLINGPKSTEALQKQCLELLDQPIHRMLQSVREEILHKEALALASASLPSTTKIDKNSSGRPQSLWTDRYRPVKFIDLIGDEECNELVKNLDRCVFKKAETNKRKRMNIQGQWNSTTNSFTEVGTGVDSDPYGRPQEKVLLLAGKPGLGKTTMAEVLAIQAGYQVIEINASDDRSSRTVTDQIKSALESRTLDAGAKFGGGLSLKSNRPTCIIIDEIDGAAAGVLVIEGSSNLPKFKSKGKNLDQRPLLRPIICICNDLYAPVLRPLRPISKIIRFNNPTQLTIVKRLQSICKSENLVADLNNLNYLVKLASGDLRSCLNTLQFISIQSHTLTDQIIKSAVEAAVKDSGSSIQNVLTNLFRIPIKKSVNSKDPSGSKQVYLNDLVRDISICGQNERIIQGCFESYLTMKQPTDLWRTIL
ncbi:hypothetical protein PSHT_08642 [Puccinia striiformis]|uniref:AAA+ ATPase domain-containing protein n=1 Tax=Puccinia striiformis TaxID=27350 RepID=A0A2S4VMU3_9BASI|nr:hypothetical protein PSHT_08642 [Puccinia striiformis]